jgi:hypothetical protein
MPFQPESLPTKFRSPLPYWGWGILAALGTFLLRIPFLFRYDLHFGGDSATCYLMSRHILQGDRPIYFYGQDYMGPLDQYLSALLFRFWGPSIPLAGAVTLFEWSLCVGIGVFLVMHLVESAQRPIVVLLAVIGIPYTLHYTTVPMHYALAVFFPMLSSLVMLRILEQGATFGRAWTMGLVFGLGWYMDKQCLPGLAAVALTLAWVSTPAWDHKQWNLLNFSGLGLGCLVGYLPELIFRLGHPQTRSLLGFASPKMVAHNLWAILLSWGAYFDAQPISRMPEAIYFFFSDPSPGRWPEGPLDVLFFAIAFLVIGGVCWMAVHSFRAKKPLPLFLSSWVLLNAALVAISSTTGGEFLSARRYLFSCSVALSLCTGLFLARGLSRPAFRVPLLCLALLFGGRSLAHQYGLLNRPDELRELRTALSQCRQAGLKGGLAHWGHAYILDALSDEQFIVAGNDVERIPGYATYVGTLDRLALVEPIQSELQNEIGYGNRRFTREGLGTSFEKFRWIPYRAASK